MWELRLMMDKLFAQFISGEIPHPHSHTRKIKQTGSFIINPKHSAWSPLQHPLYTGSFYFVQHSLPLITSGTTVSVSFCLRLSSRVMFAELIHPLPPFCRQTGCFLHVFLLWESFTISSNIINNSAVSIVQLLCKSSPNHSLCGLVLVTSSLCPIHWSWEGSQPFPFKWWLWVLLSAYLSVPATLQTWLISEFQPQGSNPHAVSHSTRTCLPQSNASMGLPLAFHTSENFLVTVATLLCSE